MTFERKFNTLIQKYNKNIIIKISDNNITLQNLNSNFDLLSSREILNGNYSFIDVWFDINEDDDTIYGIINSEKNSLIHLYINNKVIIKNTLLNYDSKLFDIKFLYIKKLNGSTHIIYYLINKYNMNHCTLIHYYKEKNTWIKTKIDTLQYNILTNFIVIFENSIPTIFYLKVMNGCEELFTSTFDSNMKIWTTPIQLTSSHKFKVYLSAIKSVNGSYHITYSENNYGRYYCNYINVSLDKNAFTTSINKTINETVACTFPNIIEHKQTLYIQWIEYNTLNYCVSYDCGKTWTKPILDKTSSDYDFCCYSYKCNTSNKKRDNFATIFACNEPFKILGIINKDEF